MVPVLDDLLPQSDGAYEPPANPGDLFSNDSPLFELADMFKYRLNDLTEEARGGFKLGYYSAVFDVWLKSGLAFWLNVPEYCVDRLVARCKAFNRTVETKPFANGDIAITVGAHNAEAQ